MHRWVWGNSGWRTQALLVQEPSSIAISRSLEERNLIVWHPESSPVQCFYYEGAELFPSEVLKLEELEQEISRLENAADPGIMLNRPLDVVQISAEALLVQAQKDREAFLNAIVARGTATWP